MLVCPSMSEAVNPFVTFFRIEFTGAFLATLIAHHLEPPIALLSISGILTFQHPFFQSSVRLTSSLISNEIAETFLQGPVVVGTSPTYDPWFFHMDMLQRSTGMQNLTFIHPRVPTFKKEEDTMAENRRQLYELFVHHNEYNKMLGVVDPGFAWTKSEPSKCSKWPITIIVTGSKDEDVDKDVSISTANQLGGKALLFIAPDQPHMFEATKFLEDEVAEMNVIREAIKALVNYVDDETKTK